jgi:hypothetical protein
MSAAITTFLAKVKNLLGLKEKTATFQLAFPTDFTYDLYANKDKLIGTAVDSAGNLIPRPDFTLSYHPFIQASPKYKLTEQTILRYIQFIDTIHDFGKASDCKIAYDSVRCDKYSEIYKFNLMMLSFILNTSFPDIPTAIPGLPEPIVGQQLMYIKPYSALSLPGPKLMTSVDSVEPHMLLLALQYCQDKPALRGQYVYHKKKDTPASPGVAAKEGVNYDDICDFYDNANYRCNGRLFFVIDTPGKLPATIKKRRKKGDLSAPIGLAMVGLLVNQETASDSCPSKSTASSKLSSIEIYQDHVYIEDPTFNSVRQYVPDRFSVEPGLDNAQFTQTPDTKAKKIEFNSTFAIEYLGMGWDKGDYSTVVRYIDTKKEDTYPRKDIGCVVNSNNPTKKPCIETNIKRLTEKYKLEFRKDEVTPGSTKQNMLNHIGDPVEFTKFYDEFQHYCDDFNGNENIHFKNFMDSINLNFTLKRAGDGLQTLGVDYINKHGLRFLKRKTGAKESETDFFEMANPANYNSYHINRAILVTIDRVCAAYAILKQIPVIFSCSDGLLFYKPPDGKYTTAPFPGTADPRPLDNLRHIAKANFSRANGLLGLNVFGTPDWYGSAPGVSINNAPQPITGGGSIKGGVKLPVEDRDEQIHPLMYTNMDRSLKNSYSLFKFLPKILFFITNEPGYAEGDTIPKVNELYDYVQNILHEPLMILPDHKNNIIFYSDAIDGVIDSLNTKYKEKGVPPISIIDRDIDDIRIMQRGGNNEDITIFLLEKLLLCLTNKKECRRQIINTNPHSGYNKRAKIDAQRLESGREEEKTEEQIEEEKAREIKEIGEIEHLTRVINEHDDEIEAIQEHLVLLRNKRDEQQPTDALARKPQQKKRAKKEVGAIAAEDKRLEEGEVTEEIDGPTKLFELYNILIDKDDEYSIDDNDVSLLLKMSEMDLDTTKNDLHENHINNTLVLDNINSCLYETKYYNTLQKLKLIDQTINNSETNILFLNDWYNFQNTVEFVITTPDREGNFTLSINRTNIKQSYDFLYNVFFNVNTPFNYVPEYEVHMRFINEEMNIFMKTKKEILHRRTLQLSEIVANKNKDKIDVLQKIEELPDGTDLNSEEFQLLKGENKMLTILERDKRNELTTWLQELKAIETEPINMARMSKKTTLALCYTYVCNVDPNSSGDFEQSNITTLFAYLQIFRYYENIVGIDNDEYDANYTIHNSIEHRTSLDIPSLFILLIEDIYTGIVNKIDLRYLEYFINGNDDLRDLQYDLNYIISLVFSYINEETPTRVGDRPGERYNDYFTGLFQRLNQQKLFVEDYLTLRPYNEYVNNYINRYYNRNFVTNMVRNLSSVKSIVAPVSGASLAPLAMSAEAPTEGPGTRAEASLPRPGTPRPSFKQPTGQQKGLDRRSSHDMNSGKIASMIYKIRRKLKPGSDLISLQLFVIENKIKEKQGLDAKELEFLEHESGVSVGGKSKKVTRRRKKLHRNTKNNKRIYQTLKRTIH